MLVSISLIGGKPVNHYRRDYTDSGSPVQYLGKAGLRLGDLEGLLLPEYGTGALETR
jgi:hypothetical protein